jgi:outer membrane protein OmpA-like peptidoglycan-associated protein
MVLCWLSIDPMADFVNYQSPYVMSDNNPVLNVDEYGLGILNAIGNLFKRLANGIANIGVTCECNKRTEQESLRDAFGRSDPSLNPFGGGSNSKPTPSPPPTGGEGRPVVDPIDNLNPAGIAMNSNDIQVPEINIPIPASYSQPTPSKPRPTPIPIIGYRARVSFNRDIEFGNSSSKLNTSHTEKTLRDLIKTLVDYPQLLVLISANVSVITDQSINRDTGMRVDGQEGTIGSLQSARARAIQRFLTKHGVNSKQILIGNGAIKTDGSNPDATFKLINPNK